MKCFSSKMDVHKTIIMIIIMLCSDLWAYFSISDQAFYNVKNYGATGDGYSKDTVFLQAAIDSCSKYGGGTVYFPNGTYLTGSLHLKSNVALYLDHGARVLASQDDADFDPYEKLDFENDADRETSFFHYSLIWGEDLERVSIVGSGIIDSNRSEEGGPKSIALKRCKYVTIKDVTILNAGNYALSMLGTDYVNIDGVSILDALADGIDPDCCHHVRISNCHIESVDDAIVLKSSFSLGYKRATENITITNCDMATHKRAFKMGTESGGGFKYITMSNCIIFNNSSERLPLSGIALESVDGGEIDNICITNISMNNVKSPVFLRLGNRGRDMVEPIPGSVKNVVISNIVATGAELPCVIAGIPGYVVENVTLDNINITLSGGGLLEKAFITVPEKIAGYPDANMFGDLPAYGLYARHVKGLILKDIRFNLITPDYRHVMVCEDVSSLNLMTLASPQSKGAVSSLKFDKVIDALVQGCQPTGEGDVFLSLEGELNKNISLFGNNFSHVKTICSGSNHQNTSVVNTKYNRKQE